MSNKENSDAWRFADETAAKIRPKDENVGSQTGVVRGEELFHRPELYRPWRTPVAQKHAEVVVAKEQEIEVLTKRCSELRSQLVIANREMQRLQLQLKSEAARITDEKEAQIESLKRELSEAKVKLDTEGASFEHQMRVLRMERESEVQQLQTKIKAIQDSSNDLGATYYKQMQDVKSAASREIDLIQQLCHARTAELSNELQGANDSLRSLQDRTKNGMEEMQAEMKRSELRCLHQMQEQEKRFERMRDTLQLDRQNAELQRDKALAELTVARDTAKTMVFELSETESRYKDWNVRILSDLDQLHEYYSTVARAAGESASDAESAPVAGPSVGDAYGPSKSSTAKGVMDSIANRLRNLTLLKQQHSAATTAMTKKISNLEAALASSQMGCQKEFEERDINFRHLLSQLSELKIKQDRLEKAFAETKSIASTAATSLASAAHRLQFFSDDLQSAASSTTKPPPPQGKEVTLLATTIPGGIALWEKEPAAMQIALGMMNEMIRAKVRQFGGYEWASDGDSLLIAFHQPSSACRFAVEVQTSAMGLEWPQEILNHFHGREETTIGPDGKTSMIFRGLRLAIAGHFGEVELATKKNPVGFSGMQVTYHGRTVLQLLHIASCAAGGQILFSRALHDQVKKQPANVLGSPSIKNLGDRRLALAHRSSQAGGYTTTESIGLVQLLPSSVALRSFPQPVETGQNVGIAQHLSSFRRLAVETEEQSLRNQCQTILKAVETLEDETATVSSSFASLTSKLRDAQIHGRIYSQADIVSHVAALDRAVSRADVIKNDVSRVLTAQRELTALLKNLEDVLVVHTKATITEDEFKRRIQAVQERCDEKIYEASLQNEHKIQQMKNSLAKLEHANHEASQQLRTCTPAALAEAREKERRAREDLEKARKTIETLQGAIVKAKSRPRTPSAVSKSASSLKLQSKPSVARESESRARSKLKKSIESAVEHTV